MAINGLVNNSNSNRSNWNRTSNNRVWYKSVAFTRHWSALQAILLYPAGRHCHWSSIICNFLHRSNPHFTFSCLVWYFHSIKCSLIVRLETKSPQKPNVMRIITYSERHENKGSQYYLNFYDSAMVGTIASKLECTAGLGFVCGCGVESHSRVTS
jgi:hypothetical protein